MDKVIIRKKVKEGIDHLFAEKSNKPASRPMPKNPDSESNGSNDYQRQLKKKEGKKEYADVKKAFERLGGPSMVDIMKLTGIEDDDKGVNRSLFRKKVKQIKNPDNGSYYQFDEKELASVRAALDIQ